MEQHIKTESNWRQLLRLILAIYVMLLAVGIAPYAAGHALAKLVIPESLAFGIFSITFFTTAYFILIGQRLRRASFVLLFVIILARINMPVDGFKLSLLHDTVLVVGLMLTGGWFAPKILHIDAPGRICLTRKALPRRAQKNTKAEIRTHAFAQSPDDMSQLFDQISEVH